MDFNTKLILENLNTAIFITDRAFEIHYANTAAEQLCNISRAKLYQYNFLNLIDYSEKDFLETIRNKNFTDKFQGFSAVGIKISPFPGRTSKIDVTISNFLSDRFNGYLVEMHTIAHQQVLIDQMQQRSQHTAARDLIRNLAHEIKNPLGGIRGAAQLLDMSFSNVQGLQDYTKVIIEQTDRLKVLVNELLGPQKPNPLVPTNIHYVIEKVLALFKLQDEAHDIKIVKDYDPSLPELNLDVDSIQQVILNIINNACQALTEYKRANPTITIKTRATIRTIINEKRYPTALEVSIINNGPKIPDDVKQTIFYPMVTTKTNGNGLGLSIALSLVERHQGTIECLSDDDKTTFKLIFPIKLDNK